MTQNQTPRRRFLKIASAGLAVLPIVAIGNAHAAKNASMRTALKYQDKPMDGKDCAACMHFVPGAKPKGPGGCKIMPGDTEISPTGYCTAWTKKS